MEIKLWPLATPFRTSSGRQGLQTKSTARQSRDRVSSVYLSDDTHTSGFIVIPEFDDPSPAITPSSQLPPNGDSSYPGSVGSHNDSYPGGSCCTFVSDTNCDDDLAQRLGFAYQYIRSMPSSTSSTHLLSPDPEILRKQLGVPQHSVLNHPMHSLQDLPNPHPEPKSLELSPTDGVLYVGQSRKLDQCIETAVYPIPPHCNSPDSFEAVQKTESIPTKSSFQCYTPDTPQITCTLNSQPSDLKRSKSVKRRVEDYPPLPSSRLRPLRGVLRKQVVNPPRSANAHKCPITLPQIRPPSPFKVDVPLHHAWHERRTNFSFSPICHSTQVGSHETQPRRTNGNTEILASLAWIGAPPTTSSYTIADSRCPSEIPILSSNRFSMAIAVEDDDISDDALVDRLERVRKLGRSSGRARDVSSLRSPDNAQPSGVEARDEVIYPSHPSLTPGQSMRSYDILPPLITQDENYDSEDTEVWHVARKALLCIREIVRTEKKYQEAIRMLLNAQTTTPPPPSMVPYISALVRVSETLLRCYLQDPSAWGVSTAFVASEDELETTMVSWCSVVGTFFMSGNDPQSSGLIGKWRLRKSGVMTSPCSSTKQTLDPPLPLMFPIDTKIRDEREESISISQRKSTPERRNNRTSGDQSPARNSSVRELAIQPIQRVMRYVLLYRDLLECTPPTSPSHLLVGRALEAATRIAKHCDRAQRNPAFMHVS